MSLDAVLTHNFAREEATAIGWSEVAWRTFWPVAMAVALSLNYPWVLDRGGTISDVLMIAGGCSVVAGLVYALGLPLDDLGRGAMLGAVTLGAALGVAGAASVPAPEAADGRGPDVATSALLKMIPLDPRSCAIAKRDQFATASVVCVPATNDAQRVHYQLFPNATALTQRVNADYRKHARTRVARKSCTSAYGYRIAAYNWGDGRGGIVCFGASASSWIEWTDNETLVLVRMRGTAIDRLYNAWESDQYDATK